MMKKIILLLFCACNSLTLPVHAQIERSFAERSGFNTNGNIALIGNTLMTCAASNACSDTQAGINNTNNNNFNMINVNIDPAAGFNNSSSAELNMPVGSSVLFAGLYWGARADETDNNRANISIKAPGQNYVQVPADVIDTIPNINEPENRPYQAMADVTNIVLASGNGTYFVGDLTTVTGQLGGGAYGGWSLAVIYQDNNQPFRRLMLFDGAANVAESNTVSVDVTGLLTPVSGSFETFIGALSWEGDAGINGDALTFEGDTINQTINSNDNFWNGSISNLDSHVTSKTPNYINQLTMDIDMIDVSDSLNNSANSANIEFSTSGDGYYPHYLAFVTELFLPDFGTNMSKTAVDLNGGTIGLGDEIEYTISFDNSGKDGATNTVLIDPIPANTTYVDNSLEVINATVGPSGVQTDSAGDDIAEYDVINNEVVFRLGDGADQNSGGTFLENEGASIKFRVVINNNAPVGDITNTATISSNSFIFPDDSFSASDDAIITLGDITPPNPPIIIAPTEGEHLNNSQPEVNGTAEPNAFVTVTGPNGETCTTQANSAGGWSCQLSPALTEGSNSLTATATDTAGNTSGQTSVTVNIDTIIPAAPIINSPSEGATVSGTGEIGATVIAVTESGATCMAVVQNNGMWSCDLLPEPVDGETATATQTDAANNVSGPDTATIDYRPDLSAFITNCVTGVKPDEGLIYEVYIINTGNVNIPAAQITTSLGSLISEPSWVCIDNGSANCDNLSGNGDLNETVDLATGEKLTYFIDTTVTGTLLEFIDAEVNTAMPNGITDNNIIDNTAFDSDLIYQFIFKNGFDCALPGSIETSNKMLESMLR